MSGAWTNDRQTSITLPTGATTGQRIVLNGVTGEIDIYDAANNWIVTINPSNGLFLSPNITNFTTAGYVQIDPYTPAVFFLPAADGVHTWQEGYLKTGDFGAPNYSPYAYLASPIETGLSPAFGDESRIYLIGRSKLNPSTAPSTVDMYGDQAQFINVNGPALVRVEGTMKYQTAGTLETWHTIGVGTGLVNGWTGTIRYRRLVSPPNTIQVYANLVPGTKVDGTTITTMPVGYLAGTAQDMPAMGSPTAAAGGQAPHVGIQAANGILWCFGVTAATAVTINSSYSLDL